jgi:hypothetical protein
MVPSGSPWKRGRGNLADTHSYLEDPLQSFCTLQLQLQREESNNEIIEGRKLTHIMVFRGAPSINIMASST